MPSLDGGHYFLTVLAPIRNASIIDPVTQASRSHRHVLAQTLALLPTGSQTAASPIAPPPSPFARNTLNHFARLVIIDQPAFNGRVSGDSLLNIGGNPLLPQPVDRLGSAYLLFAADIDAPTDAAAARRAYAEALWSTARAELAEIFGHCTGFDGIDSAAAFHDYLVRAEIETTMPFNDYHADTVAVAAKSGLPMGVIKRLLTIGGYVLAAWVAALVIAGLLAVFGSDGGFVQRIALWGAGIIAVLAVLVAVVLVILYRVVLDRAAKPFATAPRSDLPSVLKALFLQQQFTRFAIDVQGCDDAALQSRFGDFLRATQPAAALPTQSPGTLHAPAVRW